MEYLGFTGTQYIDTNFTPNQDTEIRAKYIATTSNCWLYGSGSSSPRITAYTNWNSNQEFGYGGTKLVFPINQINELVQNKTGLTLNGTFTAYSAITNFRSTGKFLIGTASADSATAKLTGRIYYVKIYDDGVLILDMIPARRKSDGAIGMYDKLNGNFFANSGTGDFIAGPEEICVDVGVGYYAPASTTNYGSVGTRTACPVGTYSDNPNATSINDCTLCVGATYNDETAQAACKACPSGYDYNTTAGKTDISECQIHCNAGTYLSIVNGYTLLDYIQSSNAKQFIRTDYKANPNTKVWVDFQLTSLTNAGGRYIFGKWVTDDMCFAAYITSGLKFAECSYDNTMSSGHTSNVRADYNRHQLVLSAQNHVESWTDVTFPDTIDNGDSISDTVSTKTAGSVLTIFSNGTTSGVYMRLYRFKIFDNNVLVHDFIPARRDSDGVLGLYDKVTNVFRSNAGYDSFTAGSDAGTIGFCTDVGVGYYAPASTTNYGSIGTRTACPAGTYTVGYGHGADEANDCGRILHLGNSVIYTRRNKPTTPALNIRMENGDMYYIGLSTTDHTVSRLHFESGGTQWTAFDDSLYYGERDYDTGEQITQ